MKNTYSNAQGGTHCLRALSLAWLVLLPGAAMAVQGRDGAHPRDATREAQRDAQAQKAPVAVPPGAERVAQFLERMGRTDIANRFRDDIRKGQVTFGAVTDARTGPPTTIWTDKKYNTTEYPEVMLSTQPTWPDSKSALIGFAMTVEHEYVHMDQTSPQEIPKDENPAWAHSLEVGQRWMVKVNAEMNEWLSRPDSQEKAAKLKELAQTMNGLRQSNADTIIGIQGLGKDKLDPEGPWPTIGGGDVNDIAEVTRSITEYAEMSANTALDEADATERRLTLARNRAKDNHGSEEAAASPDADGANAPSPQQHTDKAAEPQDGAGQAPEGTASEGRDNANANRQQARDIVVARLQELGLPAAQAMVDRLTGILDRGGPKALDDAVNELTSMQGSFTGSFGGKGLLEVRIQGVKVNGSWHHDSSTGKAKARESATVTGSLDPGSGSLTMKLTGKLTAEGPGVVNMDVSISESLKGSFTGSGYKGSSAPSGATWSVSR